MSRLNFEDFFDIKLPNSIKDLVKDLEALEKSYSDLISVANSLQKESKEIKNAQKNTGEETKKLNESNKKIIKNTQDLTVKQKERIKVEKQLQIQVAKLIIKTDENTKSLTRAKVANNEQTKAAKQNAREQLGLVGAYEKLTRKLNDVRKKFKNVAVAEGETSKNAIRLRKELTKLDTKLNRIDAASRQFQRNVGNYRKALGSLVNVLGAAGLTLGVAGFFRVVSNGIRIIKDYDESIANLRKTTNTTKKGALEIAEAIRQIDTRTSITSLLELASAAGRLGLRGDDITDFTTQVDKAFIALSDVLEGTPQEIGLTLGKIASIFKLEEQFGIGEAINKIGSALNELGANSKATEDKIIDFTNRLAGVASQANISAPDIMALGALFDEAGQSMEVSSTTMNKLLPAIGKNIRKFAKIAGKSFEEFSEIVEKDAFEALILVAKGAQSSKEGLMGLTETIQNYGISNARATAIVSVLSNSTERLNELREISNKGADEGISITEEVNKKNETLGATFEKLTKEYHNYILGTDKSTALSSRLSSVVLFLRDNLFKVFKVLGILIKGFITYKGLMFLIKNYTIAYESALKILSFTQSLFTIKTKQATVAMSTFNKTTKANPLGLLITAITVIIGLFYTFKNAAEDAAEGQDELNKLVKEGIDILMATKSIKERFAIIKLLSKDQLISLKNDINSQINIEKNFTKDLLTELAKRFNNDKELNKLKEELEKQPLDILKANIAKRIQLRKEELTEELEIENQKHSKNIRELKKFYDESLKLLNQFKDKEKEIRTGSIKNLSEELSENIKKYRELSKAERESNEIGGKLVKTIISQREELAKLNKILSGERIKEEIEFMNSVGRQTKGEKKLFKSQITNFQNYVSDKLKLLNTNAEKEKEIKGDVEKITIDIEKKQVISGKLGKEIRRKELKEDLKANLQAAQEFGTQLVSFYESILDLQIEISDREIDNRNQAISELQNSIQAETQLEIEGIANNLNAEKEKLTQEQEIRDQALLQREELQKKQELINNAEQVSSIITATANIIEQWSSLGPFGIFAGLATIATMIASFIATKIKVKNLAEGEVDLNGSGTETSDDIPANLSIGESVITAKGTRKGKNTLLALNRDATDSELLESFTKDLNLMGLNKNIVVVNTNNDLRKEMILNNKYLKLLVDAQNKQGISVWQGNIEIKKNGNVTQRITHAN